MKGLSDVEAAERRARSGPNVIPAGTRRRPLVLLARQLTHLLAVLLWVAAGLAALAGMPELSVAIVVVVVLNAAFAFWQEYRADRATERLRALLPSRATVVRSGRARSVPVSELVEGDLVVLDAGDRVGADMTLVEAHTLTLDESVLTGESDAVPHGVGDRVMSGSFVQQGTARAMVVGIGSGTTLAGISQLAESAHRPPSPLTLQLNHVVRVVAVVAFAVGAGLGIGSLLLGLDTMDAFLFGVGVSVALVPEGLLPTVTLSLARGAQRMAAEDALVRRLDAVETLGATTFICTDKTGTLTQNRMNVVVVVTPRGRYDVTGRGYEPTGEIAGPADLDAIRTASRAAVRCVTGRAVERDGTWIALGDPLEAALHVLALRAGVTDEGAQSRLPYTADRLISSALHRGEVSVLGAPEAVFARCASLPPDMPRMLGELARAGLRVMATARRSWDGEPSEAMEHDLELLGLLGLQDPPRADVADALRIAREAGVGVAMVTGDHPDTARAIAMQVGLLREGGVVLEGGSLPEDDRELARLLECDAGAVVARVTPADKLRIARAMRAAGHVVAMTGDGVNDAPALREADVGVAMGATGSDVARECADLVLLDDHFGTIVTAIELGRTTFQNVRRFLTFHLTDNVAELAPFAVWALSGGSFPLALGVMQVLALDIGTDMLPALALGAEPSRRDVMRGRHRRVLIDRGLAVRAFGVLGATEALVSLTAFTLVLLAPGWRWGSAPAPADLALASGTAFTVIAVMQIANAFACRSVVLPVWRMDVLANRQLIYAVAGVAGLLLVFVGWPPVAAVLGGAFPELGGWAMAVAGAAILVVVDAAAKRRWRRRGRGARADQR